MEFEEEDWEHISEDTRDLVAGLLNKVPRDRLGPEDVLKLTWAVSAKSLAFKKSHQRFQQTVLKSKFHRHSLSKFEADSLISRNIFKVFRPHQKQMSGQWTFDDEKKHSEQTFVALGGKSEKKSIKRTSGKQSKDDMDGFNDTLHTVEKYERKLAAFRGARRSKGTEELLQLKLPVEWTMSSQLSMIEDEID